MANGVWIILSIILILLIGFFRKLLFVRIISKKRNVVENYSNNFSKFTSDFIKKRIRDKDLLTQIVKDAHYIQKIIGSYAIADYKPPSANYIVHNHPILVNAVNILSTSDSTTAKYFNDEIVIASNSMLQYISDLTRLINERKRGLINPVTSFLEGIRVVLGIPIYILNKSGFLPESDYEKVLKSKSWRIITGLGGYCQFLFATLDSVCHVMPPDFPVTGAIPRLGMPW